MKATLYRIESSNEGTFGLMVAQQLCLYSGELPWRDNRSGISCIPAGSYEVVWAWSNHFRRPMYLLLGTEPRAGIREHSANFMGDRAMGLKCQLEGCIALGEKLGWMGGQKAVLISKPAIRRFEEFMQHKLFTLEIRDGYR